MTTKTDELANAIASASEAYYLGTETEMDDETFDALVEQLRELDPDHPVLRSVGWGLKVYGEKRRLPVSINHSLPKIRTSKDYRYVIKNLSPKIDGMSVILQYGPDGRLALALTRGDGQWGVDITPKMPLISNFNLFSQSVPDTIVRGELFIPTNVFDEFLSDAYANPRNATAGIINAKSMSNLEYLTFEIHGMYVEDHWVGVAHAENLAPCQVLCIFPELEDDMTVEQLDAYLGEVYKLFETMNYPVDGVVINGDTAFKVKTVEVMTEVVTIEWNMSNRCKYIPTLVVKPVHLYGTTVTRASGFNYQFVADHGIKPGTRIMLTKGNEVIPHVTKVLDI